MSGGMTKKGKEILSGLLTSEHGMAGRRRVEETVIFYGKNKEHCDWMRKNTLHDAPALELAHYLEVTAAARPADSIKRIHGLRGGWVMTEIPVDKIHPEVIGYFVDHNPLDVPWLLDGRSWTMHRDFYEAILNGRPLPIGWEISLGNIVDNLLWYVFTGPARYRTHDMATWVAKVQDFSEAVRASRMRMFAGDVVSLGIDGTIYVTAKPVPPPLMTDPTGAYTFPKDSALTDPSVGELDSVAHKMNEIDHIIGIFSDDGPFTAERHEARVKRLRNLMAMATFGEELRDSLEHIKELEARLEEQAFAPAHITTEYTAGEVVVSSVPITEKWPWLPKPATHDPATPSLARRSSFSSRYVVAFDPSRSCTSGSLELGDVRMYFGGKELPVTRVKVTFDGPVDFGPELLDEDERVSMTADKIMFAEFERTMYREFRFGAGDTF